VAIPFDLRPIGVPYQSDPGRVIQGATVERGDYLNLPKTGGEKGSFNFGEAPHREIDFANRDPQIPAKVKDEGAGHPGKTAGTERGSEVSALVIDKNIRPGSLAEEITGVAEKRLIGSCFRGEFQSDDILAIVDRFEPGESTAVVSNKGNRDDCRPFRMIRKGRRLDKP